MIENDANTGNVVEVIPNFAEARNVQFTREKSAFPKSLLVLGILYFICTLLMVAPLQRLAGTGTPAVIQLPTNHLLEFWGSWLPSDATFHVNPHQTYVTVNKIVYFTLTAIVLLIYGLAFWLMYRQPRNQDKRRSIGIIGLVTLVAGLIFVFTPAMLSHDIFVYAGYGRLIVAHHASPYFMSLSQFHSDPIRPIDDWSSTVSAYGPVWLDISAFIALVSNTDPAKFVLLFRLLDLAAHLLNTYLIYKILQKTGCSSRAIALGILLYAWNPLALLESALGGHNDIAMMTFVLLGILLFVHGEQHDITRTRYYLPPIIALTLAALIKFTVGPIIIFYLVIVARKVLLARIEARTDTSATRKDWFITLFHMVVAGATGLCMALLFYVPFWIGYSLRAIIFSFGAPPSSYFEEYSIVRAINEVIAHYGLPPKSSLLYNLALFFRDHTVWNIINIVAVGAMMIVGIIWLWRKPTPHVLLLASLLTLGILLIVTPWFFPWYVVWLVALAAAILPNKRNTFELALGVAGLVFSVSAFFVYFFSHFIANVTFLSWIGSAAFTTIGPPLLAFLLIYLFRKRIKSRLRRSRYSANLDEF